MGKFLTLAIAGLALGAFAHAETATVKSEYFYQTDAEKNDATPSLGYASSKADVKATGKEQKATATTLNVNYERGLTEMISVGGQIGYVTGTTDDGTSDVDNKGLDDLRVFVKGQNSFMPGSSLNYGATINWSLGDKEIKTDEVSVNSGGAGITPYVGYQWLLGSAVVGTKLQTSMNITKSKYKIKTTTPETSSDVTGGNRSMLTGFYETSVAGATIGGEIGYWNDSTLEYKDSPASDVAGETGYSLAAYTKWDFMPDATLIGRLAFEDALTDHSADSANEFNLNVGGRFTF